MKKVGLGILIFVLLCVISCKREPHSEVNVYELRKKYKLGLEKLDISKWYNNDSTINYTEYYNYNSEIYLLVAINKKNDTILKYLGNRPFNCNPQFDLKKFDNKYFLFVINAETDEGWYPIDSLKCYCTDTVTHKVTLIKRTPNEAIIDSITKKYNLKGNFELLYDPRSDEITICKDTINLYKVYYSTWVEFNLKKVPGGYELSPLWKRKYISNLGLFKNNIGTITDYLGTTSSNQKILAVKYYVFKDKDDVDRGPEEIVKIDITLNKIDEIIAKYKCTDLMAAGEYEGCVEKAVGMFRYFTGDYFITFYLGSPLLNDYPFSRLYLLDTVQWEMIKVPFFNPEKDKNYTKLINKSPFDFESQSDMYPYLYECYSIVKVGNQYRLLKKKCKLN